MLKIITLKNKQLIQNEFRLINEYNEIKNNDSLFEKWYWFKSSKDLPSKSFTLTQYWSGFKSFVQKDSELSNSKLNSKWDNNVKVEKNAPYTQTDADTFYTCNPKLKEYINQVYYHLAETFICNIDRVMIYMAYSKFKIKNNTKFTDFINTHNSLMDKYNDQVQNGIRLYNIDSIYNLYQKEYDNLNLK